SDSTASQANAILNADGSVTLIPGQSFRPGGLNNAGVMVQQSGPPQLNNAAGNAIVVNYPAFTNQTGVNWSISGASLNNAGLFLENISSRAFTFASVSGTYSQFYCPTAGGQPFWSAMNDNGVVVSTRTIGTPLPGSSQTSLSPASINFPPAPVG